MLVDYLTIVDLLVVGQADLLDVVILEFNSS